MAPLTRSNDRDETIGRPLGFKAGQVDRWLATTGISLRLTYKGRAPYIDPGYTDEEWIAVLRQLYRDRQKKAAKVDDEMTDWARIPWPEEETATIPEEVLMVLGKIMSHINNRIRYLTRTGQLVVDTSVQSTSPSSHVDPLAPEPTMREPAEVESTIPEPATPQLAMPEPLVAVAATTATLLVPEMPTADTPTLLAGNSGEDYVGPGVTKRDLSLELVECPTDWPGKSPRALGISTIFVLLWGRGAHNVPTLTQLQSIIHAQYDPPTANAYEIPLFYRWVARIGRHPQTGDLVPKIDKTIIHTEQDLEMAWIAFARVPPTEPIEIFFEIRRRPLTTG
ncbi:MAG: hypothetical protein M1826_005327 [Phylliscum demangeonii]|nr:MAG: hypothetical protein M1826_005327 [Phylliscum demangeonii]